jgi:hypothetical protein
VRPLSKKTAGSRIGFDLTKQYDLRAANKSLENLILQVDLIL